MGQVLAPRWLPGRTPILPAGEDPPHSEDQHNGVGEGGRHDEVGSCHGIALAGPGQEERQQPGTGIKRGSRREHRAGPQDSRLALDSGGLGRPGCDRPSGQVSSDGGQFRVGPRRERLAHTGVEIVLVQPSLHERDLELLGRLLAVSMRRAQVATVPALGGCYLISRAIAAPPHQRDAG